MVFNADEVARFEAGIANHLPQVHSRVFRNVLQMSRQHAAMLVVRVARAVVKQARALVHDEMVGAVVTGIEEAEVGAIASRCDPPFVRSLLARNQNNASGCALPVPKTIQHNTLKALWELF